MVENILSCTGMKCSTFDRMFQDVFEQGLESSTVYVREWYGVQFFLSVMGRTNLLRSNPAVHRTSFETPNVRTTYLCESSLHWG